MSSVAEEDRKFLQFLWFLDNCNENFKFMRMTRLPFGCKTSPFILSATIKGHIRQFREDKPKSVEMLDMSLYVDDLYLGAKDIYEAYESYLGMLCDDFKGSRYEFEKIKY
ncbi:uncharacterized protein TNIN_214041 [Trichonephila inaurata madagascariensis]|uniref:Reverse transcriptase domain-containing protein n=1 Tax=Trichonephila inaurata madagascariensis TaxID=2747483 RepID=A0A8X6XJ19_9ARAC|nr:uncharacterized protein TNIN_214041 [Trichonephila inaurata madagascariensis]